MLNIPPKFSVRLDTIIQNHLQNENFSVEMLSKELRISYTHTYRKIREVTGLSPSQYIRKKRLEKACEYLAETDLNIGEISFHVGFNTQAYFTKCFSKKYGCAPRQYRKRL